MIDPGREIRQEIIGATLAVPTMSIARSAFTGALWGGGSAAAAQFLATGGIAVAGVAAGAAAGAAVGGVAAAALALIPIWEKLSRVSLALVDSLAQIHPYYRALSGVAKVQERIQGIQWGEAVRPLMEKWFNWSLEFRQAMSGAKIAFYQAIQPLLIRLLEAVIKLSPAILALVNVIVGLIDAIAEIAELIMKVMEFGEKTASYVLGKVLGKTGENITSSLRFTGSREVTVGDVEEQAPIWRAAGKGLLSWLVPGSVPFLLLDAARGQSSGQGAISRGTAGAPSLTQTIGGATANVTVQVQDHTELTRAFEEAWSKIRRTLMEREAEMVISSMRLRETLL